MGSNSRPSSPPPRSPGAGTPLVGPPEDPRVPLRLTVTRGALGMELYEPIELGPLVVSRLSLTFPGLRFPIDLTGGVPKFRTRRGELQELSLRLSLPELGRHAAKRFGAILGAPTRSPSAWAVPDGVGIGVVAGRAALAFELLWAPDEGHARLVVANARGIGVGAPALALALRAADGLLGEVMHRSGRVFELRGAGLRIGRALLPAVGARAPSAAGVRFGELTTELDELSVSLDATFPPPPIGAAAARALELARLTTDADDALVEERFDQAREALLLALESAPRHPELVRAVCDIDATHAGRAEAALGLARETFPAGAAGASLAELFARAGERDAALDALTRSAEQERFAPLAALSLLRAAELAEAAPAAGHLDRAVAIAPGLVEVRRARFEALLRRGDATRALADAEHLEALAPTAVERHVASRASAEALLAAGHAREAMRLFERALRYVPDDPAATAGLARSLLAIGSLPRAVSLLERALSLSERRGLPETSALLELAKLLAGPLQDLPQAIARARQVPPHAAEGEEARYLEAQYRARLGDRVGASLAFARLRELIELSGIGTAARVEWLRTAARFELEERDDASLAERHLAVAVRLAPRDAVLLEEYRRAARLLDERRPR